MIVDWPQEPIEDEGPLQMYPIEEAREIIFMYPPTLGERVFDLTVKFGRTAWAYVLAKFRRQR